MGRVSFLLAPEAYSSLPLIIMGNSGAFPQRSDHPAKLNLKIQVNIQAKHTDLCPSEVRVLFAQVLKKFRECAMEIPLSPV